MSAHAINGKIGGLTRFAHEPDPVKATAPARRGFYARFEREVDPDGTLDPAERAVRAKRALRAYMATLNRRSAEVRRRAAA